MPTTDEILREHNRWRRGEEGAQQGDPITIGKAIDDALRAIVERDAAMNTLRMIAEKKRRTREQRLASACVQFLESMR